MRRVERQYQSQDIPDEATEKEETTRAKKTFYDEDEIMFLGFDEGGEEEGVLKSAAQKDETCSADIIKESKNISNAVVAPATGTNEETEVTCGASANGNESCRSASDSL